MFYIYIHIRSVFCPVLYLSKFRKEFRMQAFCTLDLKRSGSDRFRSDFDPENPIRKCTSSRRHLILFLYTVSTLWFAYGYVRSRTYIPGFTIFVSYGSYVHILTFERSYVRTISHPVRTYVNAQLRCLYVTEDVRALLKSLRYKVERTYLLFHVGQLH